MGSLGPGFSMELHGVTFTYPTADHVNDNGGPELLRVTWVLLAISTLVVLARLYVKARAMKKLFLDDYFIIAAVVVGYLQAILITVSVHHGLGRHLLTLWPDRLSSTMKSLVAVFAPAFLAPMLGRISFCFFLLWVVDSQSRLRKWPILIVLAAQVLFNVLSVLLFYVQCGNKLYLFWHLEDSLKKENDGACWNPKVQSDYNFFAGAVNSVSDLFLTVYPAVMISYTRLSVRSRIGLACLLCLSCIAMVAAIKRTIESKVFNEIQDFTYNLTAFIIWVQIELNIVIVASSVPILRPLFKRDGISRVLHRDVTEMVDSTNGAAAVEAGKARNRLSSVSSQENMLDENQKLGRQQFVITRTVEVSVSRSPSDAALAHAALIGMPVDR